MSGKLFSEIKQKKINSEIFFFQHKVLLDIYMFLNTIKSMCAPSIVNLVNLDHNSLVCLFLMYESCEEGLPGRDLNFFKWIMSRDSTKIDGREVEFF